MPTSTNAHQDDHHHHDHDHDTQDKTARQLFLPALLSLCLLMIALLFDHVIKPLWFGELLRLGLYAAAYLPVGLPVLKEAVEGIRAGNWFSEFSLMALATLGAFAIGEYPEAVAVMLFYGIGEIFQTLAVRRAKGSIRALLDERPDEVTVLSGDVATTMLAVQVAVGQIVQLKAGEKLALDGVLLSPVGTFNTAALTGESQPDTKRVGDAVLAGMINLERVVSVQTTSAYADTKLAKILTLIQEAGAQKTPTELFISKFAKVYTPIVAVLALLIIIVPYAFVADYEFSTWLYRALVFLVISCPCALVISIPLSYFGGIAAGSRHGILFKGSHFLDSLAHIDQVVMDKTGTLTQGVFAVREVVIAPSFSQAQILNYLNALECHSTHPIASAIQAYVGEIDDALKLDEVSEIAGYGLHARINGQQFLAGNTRLLDKFGIVYPCHINQISDTVIVMALDGRYVGMLTIADQIKADAASTVQALQKLGVGVTMLSGDKSAVVASVAAQLNITRFYGDLLPEDKVIHVKQIKGDSQTVAFVGDGVNDAPVIALSDVGIAMGGLGSDATIETADVVIQDDKPSKIALAIQIGRQTQRIVWQNISLAFIVKLIVLILGAGGVATMWEAVFADVGVALLAIINAMRIQRMRFNQ